MPRNGRSWRRGVRVLGVLVSVWTPLSQGNPEQRPDGVEDRATWPSGREYSRQREWSERRMERAIPAPRVLVTPPLSSSLSLSEPTWKCQKDWRVVVSLPPLLRSSRAWLSWAMVSCCPGLARRLGPHSYWLLHLPVLLESVPCCLSPKPML